MIRRSLRRRTRFGSKKGVSTVITTVFLVLTVFILSTNIFIWTLTQNALYNQAVKARNQQDVDRLVEYVIATNTTYVVPVTDTVNVTTALKNAGSISAQIVTLWVLDATVQKYNVTDLRASNINLNPGDRLPFSKAVQIPGAASADAFSAWIVTARGNKVNLAEVQTVIVSDVAQGIGSMALDFPTFGYYLYATPTKLANYPAGIVSFDIPKNKYVAFRANIRNLDPRKLTITLDSHSLFWQPGMTGVSETKWFIVNVGSDGAISSTYTPITIAYLETKTVIFASDRDVGLAGSFSRQATPNAIASVAAFLLLHGTIGSSPYGQNIPFVSIFYY